MNNSLRRHLLPSPARGQSRERCRARGSARTNGWLPSVASHNNIQARIFRTFPCSDERNAAEERHLTAIVPDASAFLNSPQKWAPRRIAKSGLTKMRATTRVAPIGANLPKLGFDRHVLSVD